MIKRHLTAAICTALFAVATPALAAEHEGFVVDSMLGYGHVDGNGIADSDYAWDVNLGYRWGMFGVEGGYVNFGSFNDRISDPGGEIRTDLDLDGWKLGLNVNANLSDQWSVMAHGGAFFWSADAHLDQAGHRVGYSDDKTDWYLGAGIDYNFNPAFSLGLGYDYYKLSGVLDTHVNVVGLRGEFRF
jgi:opacity protein-like surface antigen